MSLFKYIEIRCSQSYSLVHKLSKVRFIFLVIYSTGTFKLLQQINTTTANFYSFSQNWLSSWLRRLSYFFSSKWRAFQELLDLLDLLFSSSILKFCWSLLLKVLISCLPCSRLIFCNNDSSDKSFLSQFSFSIYQKLT